MRKTMFCAPLAVLAVVPAIAYAYDGAAPAKAAGSVMTDPAHGWNELWNHALIDIVAIGLFFSLIATYFIFK
ncbi:MAG: hypothetical protein HQK85_09915, partial [Nitrospinae bacterium]|nr:hypothetical protein [Nitrospinota bacterium]